MTHEETDRRKLSAWLDAWRLDRALERGDEDPAAADAPADRRGAWRAREPDDAPPLRGLRTGEMLLLRPVTPLTARRPVYVAVLGASGTAGWWQVAPFGRFTTPATPDEIETGLPAQPLRVLCLWNEHAVSSRRLVTWAWRVGRIAKAALAAMRAAGDERRGPRLIHPLDPRQEYLDEERALWREWDRADRIAATETPAASAADPWEDAIAAEPPGSGYE